MIRAWKGGWSETPLLVMLMGVSGHCQDSDNLPNGEEMSMD